MKVGDLVKFKGEDEIDPAAAKGIIVEIRQNGHLGTHGVMWDFLIGFPGLGGRSPIGTQKEYELELINEGS